jgi:hypothetical protein
MLRHYMACPGPMLPFQRLPLHIVDVHQTPKMQINQQHAESMHPDGEYVQLLENWRDVTFHPGKAVL